MAETERATQDMNKNWDDRVAESKKDAKVLSESLTSFKVHTHSGD